MWPRPCLICWGDDSLSKDHFPGWIKSAIRLNPPDPNLFYFGLGQSLWTKKQYEEAVSAYKKVFQRRPNHLWAHLWLAATHSMMDREKEARAEVAEALRINPKFSVDSDAKVLPYKDQSVNDRIAAALRKAGLK